MGLTGGVQAAAAPFVIELRFINDGLSDAQKKLVQQGAERVAKLFKSGLPAVTVDFPAGNCDPSYPALKGKLDKFVLFIETKVTPNVYGLGGPCDLRDGSFLPIYGGISLNPEMLTNDVDMLYTTIHEVLHALGVGSLWKTPNRISLSGQQDTRNLSEQVDGKWFYIAPKALAEYKALGGKDATIPLDPDQAHWLGEVFCTEIVSGGPDAGVPNPVSRLTLASLEDLGYSVDYTAADDYTLPGQGCTHTP